MEFMKNKCIWQLVMIILKMSKMVLGIQEDIFNSIKDRKLNEIPLAHFNAQTAIECAVACKTMAQCASCDIGPKQGGRSECFLFDTIETNTENLEHSPGWTHTYSTKRLAELTTPVPTTTAAAPTTDAPTTTAAPTTPPAYPPCPATTNQEATPPCDYSFDGSCFWKPTENDAQITYCDAKRLCHAQGGHLPDLHSQQENTNVDSILTSWTWLALEKDESGWKWYTTSQYPGDTFHHFYRWSGGDCASMSTDAGWYGTSCTVTRHVICESPL